METINFCSPFVAILPPFPGALSAGSPSIDSGFAPDPESGDLGGACPGGVRPFEIRAVVAYDRLQVCMML